MITPSPVVWVAFHAVIVAAILIDLTVGRRRPGLLTALWVTLAIGFAAWIDNTAGHTAALAFVTCYLLELSLSVDNVAVMLYLFTAREVQEDDQRRMLMWGVLGAIVLRGVFIVAGATLLQRFEWITYVFAAVLLWAGLRLGMRKEHKPPGKPWLGLSPFLATLLLIESADLVFAVDSVPAAFAVSRDPFIVYTANIFAIIGLRSLYSLLVPVVGRIRYLDQGLAAILVFVGAAMALEKVVTVPPWATLGVVILVLIVTAVLSRCRTR